MQPEYRKRRDRLKKVIEGRNIDALLVTSLVNVEYLCGFTGSTGFLLISDIHEILSRILDILNKVQKKLLMKLMFLCHLVSKG